MILVFIIGHLALRIKWIYRWQLSENVQVTINPLNLWLPRLLWLTTMAKVPSLAYLTCAALVGLSSLASGPERKFGYVPGSAYRDLFLIYLVILVLNILLRRPLFHNTNPLRLLRRRQILFILCLELDFKSIICSLVALVLLQKRIVDHVKHFGEARFLGVIHVHVVLELIIFVNMLFNFWRSILIRGANVLIR